MLIDFAKAPDERDRYDVLAALLADLVVSPDVSLFDLSQQTAAFLAGDLSKLVARTEAIAIARASKLSCVLAFSAFPPL